MRSSSAWPEPSQHHICEYNVREVQGWPRLRRPALAAAPAIFAWYRMKVAAAAAVKAVAAGRGGGGEGGGGEGGGGGGGCNPGGARFT
jgi:hypothetical protein